MSKLKTPIDRALAEFELINGAGSEADKKACAMTLLAWVCGEEWTDHPPCTHWLIANQVIRANDEPATTREMRAELVRAGEAGALDTWWIPSEAIAAALVLREGDDPAVFARTMRMLQRIAEWKGTKERAVLSGAVLSGAVLSGAVLSDADLSGADLRRADLSGADLRRAVLSDAVLSGADLRRAVLSGAVLSDADLSGAVLRGAVLSDAVLSGAVLSGAVLSDAVLSGAVLSGAVLSGAVLSGAVGNEYTKLPAGWKVSESGLVVKAEAEAA